MAGEYTKFTTKDVYESCAKLRENLYDMYESCIKWRENLYDVYEMAGEFIRCLRVFQNGSKLYDIYQIYLSQTSQISKYNNELTRNYYDKIYIN